MTHDEYLALLAHELRGPIAAISSAADLLGVAAPGRDSAEAKQVVTRQSQRLATVLDELLELGRLMSQPVSRAERVDLVALMREHPAVILRGAAGELWVTTDGARVHDAISRAGGRVEVEIAPVENGTAARLTVEPGGGLAMQFLRVLLERGGAQVQFEPGAKGRRLVARLPR